MRGTFVKLMAYICNDSTVLRCVRIIVDYCYCYWSKQLTNVRTCYTVNQSII